MPVLVPNVASATELLPPVPMHDDNTPYRFEMICNGFTDRVYGDTADELLSFLVRGYSRMSDAERLSARLHLAARVQTSVQADINYSHDLDQCSPEEQVILFGTRAVPPDVATWTCPVPLVLIDVFYEPDGTLPRPMGELDVAEPSNVLWLSPYDSYEFVVSLAEIGFIDLREHADYDA